MAENEKTPAEPHDHEHDHEHDFETEAKTVGPCKVEVTVRVPVETITKEFDNRYREIIRTVAFPGFRVGHAPRRLVERKVGDEVRGEVKEHLVTESFKSAMEKHDIDPIADPDVDLAAVALTDGQPMEYKVVFLVRPTVTLPDYETISVQAAKPEVSEERVTAVLEEMRRRQAVLEPKPGAKMESGDVAVVDVVAKVGDERIVERENVTYEHPETFLAGLLLPGIKDAILGKGQDDRFSLTETLPATWPQAQHAGKEMAVEVAVREVKRHVLPAIDDAFAQKLDFETLDELRGDLRKRVERDAEHEAEEETGRRIVDALLAATPFEIPEDLVAKETHQRLSRLQALLRMQGASEEEVDRKMAEASAAERSVVERDFRASLLLDAVAKKEKIFVTETEVDERVARMATAYHRTPEEMTEYLEGQDMLSSIRGRMREEKVMELLRKKVKVEANS